MRPVLAITLCFAILAGGCGTAPADAPPAVDDTVPGPNATPPLPPFEAQAARLYRLSEPQLRATWSSLTGVEVRGTLPADLMLHGYATVGGGVASFSPLELEQLEEVAWDTSRLAIPDMEAAEGLFGARLREVSDHGLRGGLHDLLRRAWRRPADATEVTELTALYDDVAAHTAPLIAARAMLSAILLAPHTVYRVEVGEPDPEGDGSRRHTAWELASRLAFLMTDAPPDEALLADAASGALHEEHVLVQHAERLLGTPAARTAWSRWIEQLLSLDRVWLMSKDPTEFPELTTDLRASMIQEVRLMFQDTVFDNDADIGSLLTREDTFVDRSLADLYGILPPDEGTGRAMVPSRQHRGGLLGRAAVVAVASHDLATSPTRRGKLIRERFLCQSVPPPPEGVVASLDGSGATGTTRERLAQHASDPACRACHELMDPLGLPLEGFDALGRWRTEEPTSDGPREVDTTGGLDAVDVADARELGAAVAAHPDFPGCVALQVFRHATGTAEGEGQLAAIAQMAEDLTAQEGSLQAMLLGFVTSEAFLRSTGAESGACDKADEGTTRACATDCDDGTETCRDGHWVGCTAPPVLLEACNGVDDDCDGITDNAVERACDATWGRGTAMCEAGAWASCEGPPAPPETCNGLDDDLDDDVDEGLEIDRVVRAPADLTSWNGGCDPLVDAFSADCHAATHASCVDLGCAVTGLGPVDVALFGSDQTLVCLDSTEATVVDTTFTTLASHHAACNAATPFGPACYAAIHRFCASRGEVAGYGPVGIDGEQALVVCTPGVTTYDGSYTALSAYEPRCHADGERFGAVCARAIDAWCRDQGHRAGFGPLENTGDSALLACLGGTP